MKLFNKGLSFILAIVFVFSSVYTPAFASTREETSNYSEIDTIISMDELVDDGAVLQTDEEKDGEGNLIQDTEVIENTNNDIVLDEMTPVTEVGEGNVAGEKSEETENGEIVIFPPENEEPELQEMIVEETVEDEEKEDEDADVELLGLWYNTGRYKVVGSSAKIREGNSSQYAVNHSLAKGNYLDIVKTDFNWSTGHWWGKTRQGRWTCLDNGNVERVSGIVQDGKKYMIKYGKVRRKGPSQGYGSTAATGGQIITVSEIHYNDYGSAWAYIQGGGTYCYIYVDNISVHSHSYSSVQTSTQYKSKNSDKHTKIVKKTASVCSCGSVKSQAKTETTDYDHNFYLGHCSTCGYTFSLQYKDMGKKYYQVNKNDTPVRTVPYSEQSAYKHYSSGKVVRVAQSTTNCKGKVWYKTTDGDWIYSGNLDKHSHDYENGMCQNDTCKHIKELNVNEMSTTLYEITEDSVNLKDRPYGSDTTVKKTVTGKGTIIKVVGYCYNQYWHKWYKTSDGYWVWEDYVDKHNKHNYSAGVCTNKGCGAEFKLDEKGVNKQYITNQSNVAARVKPYSNAGGSRTLAKNYVVTIKTKAKNSAGNWWYKTDKGDWIYSERLDEHKHSYEGGVCKYEGCGNVYNLDVKTYKKAKTLYTNKETVYARANPYETGAKKKTYNTFGTGVKVNAEVKNAAGNLWYRTSDNYWIFEDNLSNHAHTFTNDSEGKCSKALCGYEWPYKVVDMTPTSYYVVSESAPMWKRPYAESGKKDTKEKNDVITIVAKTTNYFGNLWYKDSRGVWIAAKHVDLRKAVKPSENDSGGKVDKNTFVLSVVNTSRKAIEGATVYFGDADGVKTDKNGQVKLDYTKASTYLKIDASGYEIFETSNYSMSSLKRDTIIMGKAEKCEIIKAELSYNNQVIDVLKTSQKLNTYNANLAFKLTCKATGSKVSEYRIKAKEKTLTSPNGVFDGLVAKDFANGQKVEVKAYDAAGNELATRKLMLDIVYSAEDIPGEFNFVGLPIKITLPESTPIIGGTKITIPIGKCPVYATINGDGDVRGGINLKFYDSSKPGQMTWDHIKSLNPTKFEKLKFDDPKPSQPFELKASVGGYIEGNVYGGKFTGKLFIKLSLDAYKEFQLPPPVQAVVIEVSFEAEATANGTVKWTKLSGFEWSTGAEVIVEPGLYAGLGMSGVWSVGVYGKGQLGIDLKLSSEVGGSLNGLWVDFVYGFKVKLLGKNLAEKQVGNAGKYYIVKNGIELAEAVDFDYLPENLFDENSYETMDRSYLENRSGWYPDYDVTLMDENSEDDSIKNATIAQDYEFHKLQMNSYTDIKPQVVLLEDLSMMIYVDDDANRDINNRTKLVYSVYDDEVGLWTEPVSVHDDLTADYVFDVMSDGENIFVVWQNATKIFDGTESITDISLATDLYVAKYDVEANAFINVERVTDNEKYELMPSVTHGNDKIIISWLENDANDVFGREGNNTIKYATKTDDEYPQSELVEETDAGETSATEAEPTEDEEIVGSEVELEGEEEYAAWVNTPWDIVEFPISDQYVTSMSAGNLYEGDYIAYTVDEDGDYTTNEDRSICLLSLEDNTSVALTDKASNAEFVSIHGDNALTWYNDGKIYYLLDPEYAPQIICDETVIPADEYHIITDDNGDMAILYTMSTDTGSEAYMLKYEDANYEWGLPIKITEQDLYIKNFNGTYKNGKIVGVFNQISIDEEINETNTLCTVTIGERHDLKVLSIDYDETTLAPGENSVKVEIQNNGNTRVSNVMVRIYDEFEELVVEETATVNLRIGAITTIDTKVVIPEEIKKTTFKVCVEEVDVLDEKTSDNFEFFSIGLPLLKTELSSYVSGEETVITATVTNTGYDEAAGSIAVYNEDGSLYQIVCDDIDTLASGEIYTYSFVLDAGYFENDMYKSVIVGIIPNVEQYTDAYNKASIYLKNPKEYGEISPDVVMNDIDDNITDDELQLFGTEEVELTSLIANTTEEDIEDAQVCVVAYDERGIFVDIIYVEDVSLATGETHEFSFVYDESVVYTVKIMLLDKTTLIPISDVTIVSEDSEESDLVIDESIIAEEIEY